MDNVITQGELIDNLDILTIIEHENFHKLSVIRHLPGTELQDYWEITFRTETRDNEGHWLTHTGKKIITPYYLYYKLKITKPEE